MLIDFGIVSVLLVVFHIVRSRVRILQELYLPTTVLAGITALLAGKQFADVIPFYEESRLLPEYPVALVGVLFATLFLGQREPLPSFRVVLRETGDTFFYNVASQYGQYALTLLFGLLVMPVLFPELRAEFAVLMPAGFSGGHGTATAFGGVFAEHGWQEARTIGFTFATVGLLGGTLGGAALVNLAVRRGWTKFVKTAQELPTGARTGFLPPEERVSLGETTVSPLALDSLTWHLALVFAAWMLGYALHAVLNVWLGGKFFLPAFGLMMLAGAGLQILLNLGGLGSYVDRTTMTAISSSVSDFLVVFAIAAIRVDIVKEYAWPIIVLAGFGFLYSALYLLFVAPRLFRNCWFERGIFVFGWNTGIIGLGIALLRIVDPRLESRTLRDFGIAYLAYAPLELLIIVAVPTLIANGYVWLPTIGSLLLFGGFVLCGRRIVVWSQQEDERTAALAARTIKE